MPKKNRVLSEATSWALTGTLRSGRKTEVKDVRGTDGNRHVVTLVRGFGDREIVLCESGEVDEAQASGVRTDQSDGGLTDCRGCRS